MRFMTNCLAVVTATLLVCGQVSAELLILDGGNVIVEVAPPGSEDSFNALQPAGPYRDDVFLKEITFGGVTYKEDSSQIIPVYSAYVPSASDGSQYTGNRSRVNAEFGDNDTDSDGNPDPFTRYGLDPADKESTNPSIQDLSIASAFSTLSLNEGVDGEEAGYFVRLIFQAGVKDNDSANVVPEIILFERGNNDNTTIRAITGGTYHEPEYAENTITILPSQLTPLGIDIDTSEISAGQQLSYIGIDAAAFLGVGEEDDTIWGIELESDGGDFYGKMLGAEDPLVQLNFEVPVALKNPVGTIPEPTTATLLLLSSSLLLCRRR